MNSVVICVILAIMCGGVLSESDFTVHFAMNAGGDEFLASDQIEYQGDHVDKSFVKYVGDKLIDLASPRDAVLYQNIRYHKEKFGYKIPMPKHGNFLLQLKFAEIKEDTKLGSRTFDVVLNNKHRVVEGLDVFEKAGTFAAYFEYVYFKINDYKIYWKDEVSDLGHNYYLPIDFVRNKGTPFVSAFVIYEGKVEVIPKLPWTVSQEQNKCVQVIRESSKERTVVEIGKNDGTVNVFYKPRQSDSYGLARSGLNSTDDGETILTIN